MIFQWFTIVFGWASLFLFIILAAYRFYKVAALPLNLRWEVYPVPHETRDRRLYGGSYMEQADWVRKPRYFSRLAELKEMGSEIFLLKRVREHNPYHLWPLSLALHWGIYLLLLWIGLLAAANLLPAPAFPAAAVGVSALLFGLCGSIGLIVKRATHQALVLYTTPVDYFNLVFLAAIFGLGIASWLTDPLFSQHQAYIGSLLFLQPITVSPVVVSMFLLLQSFAIYMPCSKLIHYVMKHFTFTETLWDDGFNVKGSHKDRKITQQLSYTINWAAPHIAQGRTWLQEAQMPSAGEREER